MSVLETVQKLILNCRWHQCKCVERREYPASSYGVEHLFIISLLQRTQAVQTRQYTDSMEQSPYCETDRPLAVGNINPLNPELNPICFCWHY